MLRDFFLNKDVHKEQTFLAQEANEAKRKSAKVGTIYSIGGLLNRGLRRTRVQNPIAANMADLVNWTLWDTITAAAAAATATSYTFYNQPIGTNSKTKNDTNLTQVSQLPAPQFYNATHMGFCFAPNMNITDITAFMNAYYFEFIVGDKVYLEGKIDFAQGGTGLQGYSNATAAAIATAPATTSNGMPTGVSAMYDLRLPQGLGLGNTLADGLTGITILQGQNFNVKLTGTSFTVLTGGAGLRVMSRLEGILSRGVA